MSMRLQKFLAHAGICSRRKAEEHIAAGRVRVNGQTVTTQGVAVEPGVDTVEFDGKRVSAPGNEVPVTLALNKPAGYISTCARTHPGQKIVLDLIEIDRRIYPVGRLDKASCGLLLLTDDGELHNRLSHPSHDHEKEYEVRTKGPISDVDLRQMADGVTLDGKKTRRASVTRTGPDSFRIILKQGLNRQIRRMVETFGNRVTHLKRVRIGGLKLGPLKPGTWRILSDQETKRFLR